MGKREKMVMLRLTPTEHEILAALARRRGTTVSALVRMAVYQVHGEALAAGDQEPKTTTTT